MNSNDVYEKLLEIASVGSTNEKLKMVKDHINNDIFSSTLLYAMDPTKIYGIVPNLNWEQINTDGEKYFDESTFELLDSLSKRELTGHAARDAVLEELNKLYSPSASLLVNILKHDLRTGFGISITNKAKPDLIPVYPYMRCTARKHAKFGKFNFKKGVYSEHKADGLYANGNIIDELRLVSRAGSEFPMDEFAEMIKELSHVKESQLHGELLVLRDGVVLDRKTGNGVLNSVMSGGKFAENEKPLYMCWDVIPISHAKSKGKYAVPYSERLNNLEKLLENCTSVKVIDYEIFHNLKDCYDHARKMIKEGKEGTVIKDPDMPWEDGTSKWQVKIKVEFECDLVVRAVLPGREGTKNEGRAGKLHCETSDSLLSVNVTVKNEKMRDHIDANGDEWIGKIMTVLSNDIVINASGKKAYSLFLGRFVEDFYRLDKLEADTFDQVKDALESCMD